MLTLIVWTLLTRPYRHGLAYLPEILRGHKMSDAVAIIGSFDLVLGEVDR